jgi:hypothetical protein
MDEGRAFPLPVLPASPDLPGTPETPETIARLIAERDAEPDRARRQDNDIRPLVSSNKALRRDRQTLRVRTWRDAETIEALQTELAQTRRARDRANRRSRLLADEVATLRSRPWYRLVWFRWDRSVLAGWLGAPSRSKRSEPSRQAVLAGDGPFHQRGFRLGDAATIAGSSAKRIKRAPSGMLIFGPYVNLPAGTYAVTLDARLYRRLPLSANFKLDVVCDNAQQVLGLCWFRLHSLARWRSFELIFTVGQDEDYADFEFRVWAPKGSPLEIGRIDLHQLTEEPPPANAGEPDANNDAASP